MKSCEPSVRATEGGQTMVFVVLVLSFFLLAGAAFAVDLSNLWLHRQIAQEAADSACTAGAMDMLELAQGGVGPPKPNFVPGTNFSCSATTPNTNPTNAPVPCWYAAANGYSANGLAAGSPSNEVKVTFPATVTGVATPPSTSTVGIAPFIQVNVIDRVQSFFMGLIRGSKTMDVGALATCGVVQVPGEVPILLLDPRNENAADLSGSGNISIYGGGVQGIQINSSSTNAIQKGTIDLSQGGPNHTGSYLGVTGATPICCNFKPGASFWDMATAKMPDPLATLPTPAKPGAALPPTAMVANGVNGCQDPGKCTEYHPGYYAASISIGVNVTAIFDPGLYYLDGSFTAAANSCVRPSTATGDGSLGTIFYFNGTGTVDFDANSGKSCPTAFPTSSLQCTSTAVVPPNLPGGISGNVLVAPCTGTYGDQLGGSEAGGEQRGILFFQNRSVQATSTKCPGGNGPCWGGDGSSAAAGTMYFHQCVTGGSDTGFNCSSSAYGDAFLMHGNSGSASFVIGAVITDQILFSGNSSLTMDLNTNPSGKLLKASLLQ